MGRGKFSCTCIVWHNWYKYQYLLGNPISLRGETPADLSTFPPSQNKSFQENLCRSEIGLHFGCSMGLCGAGVANGSHAMSHESCDSTRVIQYAVL